MIEHVLNASLQRSLPVTVIYQKGEDITQRNIKVLEIEENYIKAFCYMRNSIRVFRREQILSASFAKPAHGIKNNRLCS